MRGQPDLAVSAGQQFSNETISIFLMELLRLIVSDAQASLEVLEIALAAA
jgi:hypothetical protein